LTKTLYEATKGGEQKPMVWGKEGEKAFKKIKRALANVPALGWLARCDEALLPICT
jgi:hypothetical protein